MKYSLISVLLCPVVFCSVPFASAASAILLENTISENEVSSYLRQGLIEDCETLCIQYIEIEDEAWGEYHVTILATNNLLIDTDLEFTLTAHNMTPVARGKKTYRVPAQSTQLLYQGQAEDYSYTSSWNYEWWFIPGAPSGSHDGNIIYQLPWRTGDTYRSLENWNDYFMVAMPSKTPVHAARGGLVVGVKDRDNERVYSWSDNYLGNEIYIQHEDGTIGLYEGISQNGSLVLPGDTVETGEAIAVSGQTGFAPQAMLRFSVSHRPEAGESQYIDINFMTADGVTNWLPKNETFTAVPVDNSAPTEPAANKRLPGEPEPDEASRSPIQVIVHEDEQEQESSEPEVTTGEKTTAPSQDETASTNTEKSSGGGAFGLVIVLSGLFARLLRQRPQRLR